MHSIQERPVEEKLENINETRMLECRRPTLSSITWPDAVV